MRPAGTEANRKRPAWVGAYASEHKHAESSDKNFAHHSAQDRSRSNETRWPTGRIEPVSLRSPFTRVGACAGPGVIGGGPLHFDLYLPLLNGRDAWL
jgi:hypothetical protein